MSVKSIKPHSWQYYRGQFTRLALRDREGILDSLAQRLEDAAAAMVILRSLGYEGSSLAEMVKKVPPASLRHS